MTVGEDPESPDTRVLASVKGNLSAPVPSIAYRVVSNAANPAVGQIEWLGVSGLKAKDLQIPTDEEESERLREAKEWLADYLGGLTGGATAKAVYKAAKDAGHSERTIERAKRILGVRSTKNKFAGEWVWGLAPQPFSDEGRHEDG
jgi:hypothetical protein